ncbi:hypothetical protein BSKO_12987 [Bryopsis sp. KO-2023]|nr:hypothetical protein BSKO_12987 [Bryopsis sp. KO-2023]
MDQVQEREKERNEFLAQVLDSFPPIEAAFAYGSGVFEQPDLYDPAGRNKPMLDFVFAVDSPRSWHSQLIKYGVVSLRNLNHDLKSWQHLFLSGRLQKPVLWLRKNASLQENLGINLNSALTAALVLLPQKFTENDLLHTICNLSYSGDIRMNLAEDKRKVERIAQGSRSALINLYDPFLKTHFNEQNSLLHENSRFFWSHEMELSKKMNLIETLPKDVIRDVQLNRSLQEVVESGLYKQNLAAALSCRVSKASRRQAIAGLFAVGAYKSSRYLFEKIKKVWKS